MFCNYFSQWQIGPLIITDINIYILITTLTLNPSRTIATVSLAFLVQFMLMQMFCSKPLAVAGTVEISRLNGGVFCNFGATCKCSDLITYILQCENYICVLLMCDDADGVIMSGWRTIGMRRSTLRLSQLTTAESVQTHWMWNMNQFMWRFAFVVDRHTQWRRWI